MWKFVEDWVAPKEEQQRRRSICNSCESRNEKRCGECGCFLIAICKIQNYKCPLNKWERSKNV